MRRGHQLSLLGFGPGKGRLFEKGVVERYLRDRRMEKVPDLDRKTSILSSWVSGLAGTSATESSLEASFVSQVFAGVLGYGLFPATPGQTATLYPKPSSKVTGISRPPDAVMGVFSDEVQQIRAVLELKTPGTDLDRPQARANAESPVDQAFSYGLHILGVRWVLVSDMRLIRLYSVESNAEYEEIDLAKCVSVEGAPTDEFRKLYYLFSFPSLLEHDKTSSVSLLYRKSSARQLEIRDGFYEVYYRIRSDLYHEVTKAAHSQLNPVPGTDDLLQATQRLLDRLLFIYYCEDHPEQLISHATVEKVIRAAQSLPGRGTSKTYHVLKDLFREVDEGSAPGSGLTLAAYNGELFKTHPIIDAIDLPDSLASKIYVVDAPHGERRRVLGPWGLHVFDFWTELNEHLLGHIFEESLSDLQELGAGIEIPIAEKLAERKQKGIYYTSSMLSDFLASSAIRSLMHERAPGNPESTDVDEVIERRMQVLTELKVIDPACGSGAFLVSSYREMLSELWRLQAARQALQRRDHGLPALDMFEQAAAFDRASVLRNSIFGVDLLPQAVEIAKLALWLHSARKGERVSDLSRNIVPLDSLDVPELVATLGNELGSYDLVIGNPPWGAHVDPTIRSEVASSLGLDASYDWDSWELFLALAAVALAPGGRLAFVLPDSFLYPEKARTRRQLLDSGRIEKVLNLGPDWFGSDVRMGTVLLQFRKGEPAHEMDFVQGTLLAGDLRRDAIRGDIPLLQVEAQRSREIAVARVLTSPGYDIEIFRGARDDQIISRMQSSSATLSSLCEWARGEEINKAGVLWVCSSCLLPTVPGRKKKGGGYSSKQCHACGHTLRDGSVQVIQIVNEQADQGAWVPFFDGDDIRRRYQPLKPSKWMRLDVSGWAYKDAEKYKGPKILVRQAGVGLLSALDRSDARCPQSIYIYRLLEKHLNDGLRLEFVVAALLSRTMAYYVFKRWAEVDPAKAHAKLTHTRLSELPIPAVSLTDKARMQLHDEIVSHVAAGTAGDNGRLSEDADRRIELALRELWGLSPDDGAYINGEFFDLPYGQVVRDLFPRGVPRYTSN